MTSIDAVSNKQSIFAAGTKNGKFGDNPFLQLLVTQLQAQTPLEPVDNNSFMSQLSQLSTMEEQKEMNSNLMMLLEFQGALARMQGLSQGSEMIGRQVDYVSSSTSKVQSGVVESVRVNEKGKIILQIGKESVELDSVVGVRKAKDQNGEPKPTQKTPTNISSKQK